MYDLHRVINVAVQFQLYLEISQYQNLGIILILQGRRLIGFYMSNKARDSAKG